MIFKCTMNQTEPKYTRLNESDIKVVKFHQNCLGVGDDGWVNNIYFDQVVNKTMLITKVTLPIASLSMPTQT